MNIEFDIFNKYPGIERLMNISERAVFEIIKNLFKERLNILIPEIDKEEKDRNAFVMIHLERECKINCVKS